MKNKNISWMTIIIMAFVYVGFVSCSSDDDDNNTSLTGTWVTWEIDNNIVEGYYLWEKRSWVFGENGNGQFYAEGNFYQKEDGYRNTWNNSSSFNYTKTGGKQGKVNIEIRSSKGEDAYYPKGNTYEWNYMINGNNLTLNDELLTAESVAKEPNPTEDITITEPEISILAATATSIEFNVSIKVESEEFPDYCYLYYGTSLYSGKEPTNYNNVKCRYSKLVKGSSDKHAYYYTASKAGFAGATSGSRIYYYVEAKNSAGTVKSPVQYVTIQGGWNY